nr:MAG TPA: hypothetical protein [Herelleviridae sp.]
MVQGTQIHYNGNTVHASAALNSLSSTLPRVACSLFPMYIALIKVMCHSHENHIYIYTYGSPAWGTRIRDQRFKCAALQHFGSRMSSPANSWL